MNWYIFHKLNAHLAVDFDDWNKLIRREKRRKREQTVTSAMISAQFSLLKERINNVRLQQHNILPSSHPLCLFPLFLLLAIAIVLYKNGGRKINVMTFFIQWKCSWLDFGDDGDGLLAMVVVLVAFLFVSNGALLSNRFKSLNIVRFFNFPFFIYLFNRLHLKEFPLQDIVTKFSFFLLKIFDQ